MPRLPDVTALGERPTPQPAGGIVGYRADFGGNEAPGAATAQVGAQIGVIMEQLQEKADTTRVEDAWNRYKNTALDLTAGEKGLLKLKGGEAVNANMMQTSAVTLGAARGEIEAGLANDNQRRRFAERAAVTDLQVKHQVLSHMATEQKEYDKQVMMGSEAAAKAQIAATPTSLDVFLQAKDTLMKQADAYLKSNGVTDKKSVEGYKAKVTDALWATRIEALLYDKPILADAMFRANAKEITNPELKLLLQHKTRDASVTMNAGRSADKDVADAITGLMKKSQPRATPEGGPDTGSMTDTGVPMPKSVRQNNPGNIVDIKTGEIRTFATPAEGAAALESEIKLKLSGASPAYKTRFGTQPVTPARLAETWAPAAAPGNSATSTTNYANAIALALGIKPSDPIPNTPEAVASVKKAITAFEAGAYGSTTAQRVGNHITTASQYQTNDMPNARDVAAQLPVLLAKAQKRADELYGPDQTNPDRFAFLARYEAAIRSQLGSKVAQLTAIQKEYLDEVSDFVQGFTQQAGMQGGVQPAGGGRAGGPGMIRVTSIPMLQAMSPEMFQKWQRLDRSGREHIAVLMEHAQRADERGTPTLYNEYRHRINLPPDHPDKVNWIQTISQDPRVAAGGLSQSQWSSLRTELKESATDDGRSQAAKVQAGVRDVRNQIMGDGIFTNMGHNKDKAEYAIQLWQFNADKVIGQYKAANKDIGPLFDPTPGAKESLITPEAVRPFKIQAGGATTTAQMLKEMAAKAGAPAAQPPAQMPATITTKEAADAWIKTLPPTVDRFVGPDGQVRMIPASLSRGPALVATTEQPRATEQLPPVLIPPVSGPTQADQGKAATAQPAADDQMPVRLKKPTSPAEYRGEARTAVKNLLMKIIPDKETVVDMMKSTALWAATRGAGLFAGLLAEGATMRGEQVGQVLPTEREVVNTVFRNILAAGYTDSDVKIIKRAIEFGDLTPAEMKKAKYMLADIEGE